MAEHAVVRECYQGRRAASSIGACNRGVDNKVCKGMARHRERDIPGYDRIRRHRCQDCLSETACLQGLGRDKLHPDLRLVRETYYCRPGLRNPEQDVFFPGLRIISVHEYHCCLSALG